MTDVALRAVQIGEIGSHPAWIAVAMAEGEHPPECAEQGSVAPAFRGATASDCTHAFDESADDGQQDIHGRSPHQQPFHPSEAMPAAGYLAGRKSMAAVSLG